MKLFTLPIASLAALLISAFFAMPAQAQSRVFVAAQGSDGNPCTFAQPCRTFQHAHDAVAPKGEIDVLDPAGYGTVVITKSISIQGHGFSGVSVATGGTAITINAGTTVNLSGLIIEGAGIGATGIAFENCVIRRLTGRGVDFHPNAHSNLTVSNILISDNGGRGIIVAPSGATTVNVVFNRVEVYNNTVADITLNPG
jgi:hypothetical protein